MVHCEQLEPIHASSKLVPILPSLVPNLSALVCLQPAPPNPLRRANPTHLTQDRYSSPGLGCLSTHAWATLQADLG